MIPFDFEYFRPTTLNDAFALFQKLSNAGKTPMYFSGGTEIITLGRINELYTDAVIDMKGISEYQALEQDDHYFYFGAGKTLAEIGEANVFPLLTKTVKDIADHTARTKITLGGNICANIFYREAVLPFLVTDSYAFIVGKDGTRTERINDIFKETLQLQQGEFLLQVCTEKKYFDMPHIHIKRRKQWFTGYPLITIVAVKESNNIKIAISGLTPYPFRSKEMEASLNDKNLTVSERINAALDKLQKNVLTDTEGSAQYRLFVMKNLLYDVLDHLEGEGGIH
ncbi:FAD binding domain-containing protein [Evansella cellulosilytica]|uniref:Molybdopterin dehydrogenase FAD-binding protein n=1 Tax=Evansella cellulosilytica (strain ATCC 21833 / DSM 2522 / FERM P-1141 / JCM 9156 / N-4) TaxID=649639 RepID=E6U0X8_EVAC2|nr:FAD binding domain-containing protein [Evansella cellulosilytica]ADU30290.1 molybdopterin dehydrogenase FAD-binding protein [Evansella cellulosilytica DSM 2522]